MSGHEAAALLLVECWCVAEDAHQYRYTDEELSRASP